MTGVVGCQSIGAQATKATDQALISSSKSTQGSGEIAEAHVVPNQVDFKKLKQQNKRPIVALVLGSGGARGYAHIGVIQVLEQHGIRPDFIVGTSAGSIVGSIYASGKSADELRDIALNMKPADVREIRLDKKGVLDGKKVEDYVNTQVDHVPLEKLKIPMYVVATELQEGHKVVFNAGNTGQAVRASVSIPSMFIPAVIQKQEYVDGGLVSPVPVDTARELGADIIIAVDILAKPIHTETSNVWGLFNQNINIMQFYLAKEEMKRADVVIQPDLREKAHIFDVKGREATMQAGVEAADEKLNEISLAYAKHHYPLNQNIQYTVQQ
ncbi:patatin-like phospholipase family protein [Acinetobacter sp. SwsAc6]|jgi:NTE family protein|uniref:patatin-like phospholipase family protein n=1 Tax=Acinetobacter TaxID=469 RepID=UPI000D115E78|nr:MULTISPECIES: patatin-like phospholipase family protein [Acinetobacter]NWK74745.1 patatin-like phospholipase family protein [Acinetobacter sp. SwsAc6]QCO21434.1 patatin-like phospholipase family protein [Acinetobacter cumulans]RFS29630.1 patatin-like phospholipase family protein [Acinetobacter sp. SWAC5]RKG42880.1 patatin-like phospholipase family protein [Acinetobacter cumulans]RKG49162.1 patatin-like phospholipase family protein [Acinetobacter cumulans]